MATTKKPNTICRWCEKKYYACKYCQRTQSWRSFCCSVECHEKYVKAILDNRELEKQGKFTLQSTKEIEEVKSMSPEEALETTKEDLKDYLEENPDKSLTEVLDVVNSDIEKSRKRKKKSTN
jgi:hypothetical protein